MRVQFLEVAEVELAEAISYLNDQSEGLGFEFAAEVKQKANAKVEEENWMLRSFLFGIGFRGSAGAGRCTWVSCAIFLLALSLLFCGCPGGDPAADRPGDLFLDERFAGAAMETVVRFNQSGMREDALPAEIPEEYWVPEIVDLKPQKVFWHNNNLALVLKDYVNEADGIYVHIPISSYLPGSDTIMLTVGKETYVFRVVE